jgi:hypothetical protein
VRTVAGSALALLVATGVAAAQNKSFGGPEESFKGKGDREPPICLLDTPRLAGEGFHVMWDCRDNDAKREDIRTELWLQASGSPIYSMVGTFLGFPASVQVTNELVGKENFREAFPIRVKLLARDSAGNSTVSPVRTVEYATTKLRECDLLISERATTTGTDDEDETTSAGVMVDVRRIPVTASSTSSTVDVTSFEPTLASKCELDSVCSNEEKVSIRLNLSRKASSDTPAADEEDTTGEDAETPEDATADETESTQNATGSLQIIPGASDVSVAGEISGEQTDIDAISVTGTAEISNRPTRISVTCR